MIVLYTMDRFASGAERPALEIVLPIVKQEEAQAPRVPEKKVNTDDFDATYVDLTKPDSVSPLDIVYLQLGYSTIPTKVVLRFARTLSSALGKRLEEVYSHECMHYLVHTVCKGKADELDRLLVQSLDTVYQFLFNGVHYIIERTLLRISEYIGGNTTLYQVIGDEQSLAIFVQLCSSNHHRLRLEGGIKTSNNPALQMADVTFNQRLHRYAALQSLSVKCETDDESFDFQPRESNEQLGQLYELCMTAPEWSMVLLLHQATLKPFDERGLLTRANWKKLVTHPASWASWMNPAITDAIQQSWINNNGTMGMAAMLTSMSSSRYHCILFANLVGVCHHLKQFEQQMYKRTPVVTLLLRTQRELLELLHA